MSTPDPDEFTRSWLDAWNAHDIEAVLKHFSDDVVFTSPMAIHVLNDSDGFVHGKDALRTYWMMALQCIPDLHFELVDEYVGVSAIVINYRNQTGRHLGQRSSDLRGGRPGQRRSWHLRRRQPSTVDGPHAHSLPNNLVLNVF